MPMKFDSLPGALPFGGPLLKNSHAKSSRPLRGRRHIHVVMKLRETRFHLQERAHRLTIRRCLRRCARQYGLSPRSLHCDGRQIHFSVYLRRKESYAPFIRMFSGLLALKIGGAAKGRALKEKFWACRPWTCVEDEKEILWSPSRGLHRQLLIYLDNIGFTREPGQSLQAWSLGP